MTVEMALLAVIAGAGRHMATLRRRVRTLERQAITDPLTGAFNRRYMHTALATAVERCRRSSEPASLLLLDVDRFKPLNDTIGHAAGDRVLKAIVTLVDRRLRLVDSVFRLGGDEFVVLLSGARAADARVVAEELRTAMERVRVVQDRLVSISIGIAELSANQSPAEWLAEADAALYDAKRAGRNRVASLPDPSIPIRRRIS